MAIRSSSFAGTWYPGSKGECLETIESFVKSIPQVTQEYVGIGGIVPHAGWFFSGKTACSVFKAISEKSSPELIFISGMHLPPGSPNYLFVDEGFDTPLGIVSVHKEAMNILRDAFHFVEEDARNYTPDNTVELQLPFIHYFFPNAKVVTMGIAPTKLAIEVGKKNREIAIELGVKAAFIGSTDLTHYGPNYGFMPHGTGPESVEWVKKENDRRIIEQFLAVDPWKTIDEALKSHNACCPGAAACAIAAVQSQGVQRGVLAYYTTSYDIHPDVSFVGYAGIVF